LSSSEAATDPAPIPDDLERRLAPAEPVSAADLANTLHVYHDHCRYLNGGWVDRTPEGYPRIVGTLGIAESCYIADTGHFNAVEFNISYNQLVYVLIAEIVARGWDPAFEGWSLADFHRRQLPDILIHSFQSRFSTQMDRRAFLGRVWIERCMRVGDLIRIESEIEFGVGDAFLAGEKRTSRGSANLAIVPVPTEAD
jgi:hypothetical protein